MTCCRGKSHLIGYCKACDPETDLVCPDTSIPASHPDLLANGVNLTVSYCYGASTGIEEVKIMDSKHSNEKSICEVLHGLLHGIRSSALDSKASQPSPLELRLSSFRYMVTELTSQSITLATLSLYGWTNILSLTLTRALDLHEFLSHVHDDSTRHGQSNLYSRERITGLVG